MRHACLTRQFGKMIAMCVAVTISACGYDADQKVRSASDDEIDEFCTDFVSDNPACADVQEFTVEVCVRTLRNYPQRCDATLGEFRACFDACDVYASECTRLSECDEIEGKGVAPIISDLQFEDAVVSASQSGELMGNVLVNDPDADVMTAWTAWPPIDEGGVAQEAEVSFGRIPQVETKLWFLVPRPQDVGTHSYEIWVQDSKGNDSNHLVGSVEVVP
ncbi:hypothetical protein ACFL6C_02285 [Myxococcota bacterium]